MVRQAAGDFVPLVGSRFMDRQSICAMPVSRKEMKIGRISDRVVVSGKVHSTAIQSLTSPAPIQPPNQAETSTKQASHKSR